MFWIALRPRYSRNCTTNFEDVYGGWHSVTRKPTVTPNFFTAHDHGGLDDPCMIEDLPIPIKRAFGPSTVEVRSFARRTCRIPCDRPPRDLCVPPSVVSSSLSSPHSPHAGKFQFSFFHGDQCFHLSASRGPVSGAHSHLDLEMEPEWFLQRVRAAAAQFRRVLQPQRVGYSRQGFCG